MRSSRSRRRANRGELVGSDLQAAGVVERQRRLRQDRGEHRRLEHHRQREVAGEAHADRADAATTALLVREPGERAQPHGHRARLAGGERAELGADARAAQRGRALLDARHGAVAAEQRGHVHGESGVANPAAEAGDVRADAGHLRHHDHRRSAAGHVHHLGDAVECDCACVEVLERVVLVDVAFGLADGQARSSYRLAAGAPA